MTIYKNKVQKNTQIIIIKDINFIFDYYISSTKDYKTYWMVLLNRALYSKDDWR